MDGCHRNAGWRDTAIEDRVVQAMSHSYKGTHVHLHWQFILAFYQNLSRPSGLMLAMLLILTFIGFFKARGAIRLGIALFGLSAFGLYLIPVMTLSYAFRYGIPPETFIVASGVLGAASRWPPQTQR
jgi:lipopolysaccharide export LptBFGC system permease protein LptF